MMLLIVIQFVMATLALVNRRVILQYCIESVFFAFIQVLTVTILAYSATRINRTIKEINTTLPNERLTKVHIVNSVIYSVFFIGLSGCLIPFFWFLDDQESILKLYIVASVP